MTEETVIGFHLAVPLMLPAVAHASNDRPKMSDDRPHLRQYWRVPRRIGPSITVAGYSRNRR